MTLAYAFLDPNTEHGFLAEYIIGIAIGYCVQVSKWLLTDSVAQLVLAIISKDTWLRLERWVFDINLVEPPTQLFVMRIQQFTKEEPEYPHGNAVCSFQQILCLVIFISTIPALAKNASSAPTRSSPQGLPIPPLVTRLADSERTTGQPSHVTAKPSTAMYHRAADAPCGKGDRAGYTADNSGDSTDSGYNTADGLSSSTALIGRGDFGATQYGSAGSSVTQDLPRDHLLAAKKSVDPYFGFEWETLYVEGYNASYLTEIERLRPSLEMETCEDIFDKTT
ncbi:hypothetical protein BU15DRAFT_84149 [Melanogaster broomeanus]|nr:hypothetical protein BU15DRAFT_84149 [Melanogaster broomeanus]